MELTKKSLGGLALAAAIGGAAPGIVTHQSPTPENIRAALFAEHNQMVLDGCLGAVRELRNLCSGLGQESDCLKHAAALESRCKEKSQKGDWSIR